MTPLLALVTVGSAEEGARIARALVEGGLAACVNVLPAMASVYRWQGKVEEASEHLLVIKTVREHWDLLQAEVRRLHSYECPEIVALAPEAVEAGYAAWWGESVLPVRGS